MAAEDPMMRIRIPPELKAQVEEAARAANRSMNAEIIHRLEVSFAPPKPVAYADVLAGIEALIEQSKRDAAEASPFRNLRFRRKKS